MKDKVIELFKDLLQEGWHPWGYIVPADMITKIDVSLDGFYVELTSGGSLKATLKELLKPNSLFLQQLVKKGRTVNVSSCIKGFSMNSPLGEEKFDECDPQYRFLVATFQDEEGHMKLLKEVAEGWYARKNKK